MKAQDKHTIDSLETFLKTAPDDSLKARLLDDLSSAYEETDSAKAILYANKEIEFSKKINYISGISGGYSSIGAVYYIYGEHRKSLGYYRKCAAIAIEDKNKRGVGSAYSNIAGCFEALDNIDSSIYYYIESTKLFEESGVKEGAAINYGTIGDIFNKHGDSKRALEYMNKGLKIVEELNIKPRIAVALNNIGLVYSDMKQYDKALSYFMRSMKIKEEINDRKLGTSYINIGDVYFKTGDYQKAYEYHDKAVATLKKVNYIRALGAANVALANTCNKLQKFDRAKECLDSAMQNAKFMESKDLEKDCYISYAEMYYGKKEYLNAYDYLYKYLNLKDSLYNDNNNKQIQEMQTRFETEKKDNEILLLNQGKALQDSEIQKQTLLRNSFIAGFILFVLLSIFILRGYRAKRLSNIELENRNMVIGHQKQEITDSINYARRIQDAILPDEEDVRSCLKESFILYLPKDIVAGDFYWMQKTTTGCLIAAADCTGHGVPGAFMSLVGKENLDKSSTDNSGPGKILAELNRNMKRSLKQDKQNATRDGMDICLVKVITGDAKTKIIYSGANRPLWIIRKDATEIVEIKATKCAIAGLTENDQKFDEHEIELEKGDLFYVFSDGYGDQFGGDKNKKFSTKRLKELLAEVSGQSMNEQKIKLQTALSKWRANYEQVDDVLIIGVRV